MKSFYLILLLMVSQLMPSLANAEEPDTLWFFQPRLTTGMMLYEFEYAFTAPGAEPRKLQFDDYMPFVGGGATLAYDNCLTDFYYQRSVVAGKDGGAEIRDTESVLNKADNEFDRKDYALTFGCEVTKNLSLFAGYKVGKTDIQMVTRRYWLGDRIDDSRTGNTDFKSKGPFIGVAYSHPIGSSNEKGHKKGQLGFKLAVTKLEAEYAQLNTTIRNNKAVGDGAKTINVDDWSLLGDTISWTAGVNWTAPIYNKHFSYRFSLDYYNYDFDIDSAYVIRNGETQPINILGGGMNYDLKETMYTFQMQLLYQF
jgi:hypothetical protein